MEVPHDINTKSIESHSFDHLESMLPILMGDSGVMDFRGEDFLRNSFVFVEHMYTVEIGFVWI